MSHDDDRPAELERSAQSVTMSPPPQPLRDSVNPRCLQLPSHSFSLIIATPSSLPNAITRTLYCSTPAVVPRCRHNHDHPGQPLPSPPVQRPLRARHWRHPEPHLNHLSANAFESGPAGAARPLINALKTTGMSDVAGFTKGNPKPHPRWSEERYL